MGYILVSGKDFNEIRRKIRELQKDGKQVVFTGNDDELNRKILEKERVDVLLLVLTGRRDKQKQRNSGFNQVLAKIAKKKQVSVGINLDEILAAGLEEKAEILARIRQNIEICSKDKLKMVFLAAEARSQYDLKALGLVLGMPTWMTRDAEVIKWT